MMPFLLVSILVSTLQPKWSSETEMQFYHHHYHPFLHPLNDFLLSVPNLSITFLSIFISLNTLPLCTLMVSSIFSHTVFVEQRLKVAQLCPTLCESMDSSAPGSSVHWILQARISEWVAIPFSRGSSQQRYLTQASHIAGEFFIV